MAVAAWVPYVIAAVGAIYTGVQANKAAKYDAQVAEQNAKTAQLQGNAAEETMRRHIGMQLGEQRASAAQSGFDSSSGSFAALQVESAQNAELDALTSRYTGEMQSLSFGNQAKGMRASGRAAQNQGFVNAAGSLMAGGAKYGSSMRIPTNQQTDISAMYQHRGDT